MLATLLFSVGGLVAAGGGLWVAALFVPPLAALVKSTLDFLRSPIGTLAGVGGLCLFLFLSGWIGGDVHGSRATRAAWAADVAAKSKAAAEREIALRLEMKKLADGVLTIDGAFSTHIDDEVKTYVPQNPIADCRRATGDDVRRLLSIQ